jgi:hypothetical protein
MTDAPEPVGRARRLLPGALLASAVLLGCARPAEAQRAGPRAGPGIAVTATIGAYFEDNDRVGHEELLRLPMPLTLGFGSPRSTQLEIEPSAGWHSTPGGTDASGLSWTRFRGYHFFGAAHRASTGPDVEIFFKTQSDSALGFGYTRVMPGWQIAYRFRGDFRATLRARYEFSGGEDPGVSALSRIVVRPMVFLPPAGRFTSWARADIAFDLHGGPRQYNVEANAGLHLGPRGRLTVFAQPRVYIGAASRTSNLWRLRTGMTWSLGNLVVHHGPHESDLRQPTFGESSPSKP